MKKIAQRSLFVLPLLLSVMPAFAEAGARQDNSMFLVYLFLGICAMIIFVQLVPVLTLAFGLFAGIFGKRSEKMDSVTIDHRS